MFSKFEKVIFEPGIIRNKIRWHIYKRRFKNIGKNVCMGRGFNILGPEQICLGNNFCGGKNLQLWTWPTYNGESTGTTPELVIGDNVTATDGCAISCMNKIHIGNGTLLGRGTFITDNGHGKNDISELGIPPAYRKLWSKGPVFIGNNVWTGINVCILPNVNIGDNAIIGANSVVTHDIPANCIAAGAPAKVVRLIERKENTLAKVVSK